LYQTAPLHKINNTSRPLRIRAERNEMINKSEMYLAMVKALDKLANRFNVYKKSRILTILDNYQDDVGVLKSIEVPQHLIRKVEHQIDYLRREANRLLK
jgi:hypothetical protein